MGSNHSHTSFSHFLVQTILGLIKVTDVFDIRSKLSKKLYKQKLLESKFYVIYTLKCQFGLITGHFAGESEMNLFSTPIQQRAISFRANWYLEFFWKEKLIEVRILLFTSLIRISRYREIILIFILNLSHLIVQICDSNRY